MWFTYKGQPEVTGDTIAQFMRGHVTQAMTSQRVTITERNPWLKDYDHQKREYVFGIEGVRAKRAERISGPGRSEPKSWLEPIRNAEATEKGRNPEYALTFAPMSTEWKTGRQQPSLKLQGGQSSQVIKTVESMARRVIRRRGGTEEDKGVSPAEVKEDKGVSPAEVKDKTLPVDKLKAEGEEKDML